MGELSESYEGTIESVKVTLVLSGFACDPDEITAQLGLEPDQVLRKGESWKGPQPTTRPIRANQWALDSRSDSKDVNVQMRELLDRLSVARNPIRVEWNPFFNVLWKGTYLYAGSGPFYERDVLRRVADMNAEIWQDIYQVDRPGEEDVTQARDST